MQKQAFDFQVKTVDLSGVSVCVATDGMDCDLSALKQAYVRDDNDLGTEKIFTYFAKENFIGFNTCSILCQDWLINKAVTIPCVDSIAIDYNITLKETDTNELDQDRMQEMKTISNNRFKIKTICKKFAQNKRKYGQSLCVPLIEGVDYSKPFNIDAIRPKSYKGMMNVEPVWFNPVLDMRATTEPLSRRYYQPTWFKMANGSLIHHSWAIFNCYSEVSDILKPKYYFGGISLKELVNDPTISASEAATLNGVQVTSMVNIASQVAKNELSRESAIAILQKSFNMSEQEAKAIIGNEKLEQPSVNGKMNAMKTQDSWNESDYPRDNNGQFSQTQESNSSMKKEETKQLKTSDEEKQNKINSVKIDPTKDNIFPELNKEEQEKLGVGNKKVRLKKSIFERNQKHNDVNKGDDNYIIGNGLYKPDMVLPAKSPNYHHFISHIGDNKNSIVLIDVVSNGEYLDIVHYY